MDTTVATRWMSFHGDHMAPENITDCHWPSTWTRMNITARVPPARASRYGISSGHEDASSNADNASQIVSIFEYIWILLSRYVNTLLSLTLLIFKINT